MPEMAVITIRRLRPVGAETETPTKPAEAPPDQPTAPGEDEELGKKVRRIIREIPDPTPQPGGE